MANWWRCRDTDPPQGGASTYISVQRGVAEGRWCNGPRNGDRRGPAVLGERRHGDQAVREWQDVRGRGRGQLGPPKLQHIGRLRQHQRTTCETEEAGQKNSRTTARVHLTLDDNFFQSNRQYVHTQRHWSCIGWMRYNAHLSIAMNINSNSHGKYRLSTSRCFHLGHRGQQDKKHFPS